MLISVIVIAIVLLITIVLFNVIKREVKETTTNNACLEINKKCSDKEINNGKKIDIDVSENETLSFYIIDNDEEYLTLLLDHNLDVSSYSKESNLEGPVEALKTLSKKTTNWKSIEKLDYYMYQDYGMTKALDTGKEYREDVTDYTYAENPCGYASLTIDAGKLKISMNEKEIDELKARLATYEEMKELMSNKKLPKFLIDNLSNGEGYWTLTASPETKKRSSSAYAIVNEKGNAKLTSVKVTKKIGVRPVIKVSKNEIKNLK